MEELASSRREGAASDNGGMDVFLLGSLIIGGCLVFALLIAGIVHFSERKMSKKDLKRKRKKSGNGSSDGGLGYIGLD